MRSSGYMLITLMFVLTLMSLALMIAVPVWETQVQRENEEELIFRGKQYIEAVRLYQLKNPGQFPDSLEAMLEERCLRRPFKDPMIKEGEWNVVLLQDVSGGSAGLPRRGRPSGRPTQPAAGGQQGLSVQKVLVVPLKALSSVRNVRILGVVSSSTKRSIRIYNDQESYDKWLFFYGQDPQKMPEIVYYGETGPTR